MRILTVGLTPAVQQIMLFEKLRIGGVNRAQKTFLCASGKAVNAAIGVETLDRTGASVLLTPLAGPYLETMSDELRSLGVVLQNCPVQSATRTCTTLIDQKYATVTEFVENGKPMSEQELNLFADLFHEESRQAEMLILTGSLPNGCPHGFYRRLLDRLERPIPFLCDIRGEELLQVLDLQPLFVKPNREELGATFGQNLSETQDLLRTMKELNRLGAQWVVVTDNANAIYLSSLTESYQFDPIPCSKQEVVNPIGCGDAMSAGISWATCLGASPVEAVRIGIAAAYLNLKQILPCRLDSYEVRMIAEQVLAF